MKYTSFIVWCIWTILLVGGVILPLAGIIAIIIFPKLEFIHIVVLVGMIYVMVDIGRTVVTNLPWKTPTK